MAQSASVSSERLVRTIQTATEANCPLVVKNPGSWDLNAAPAGRSAQGGRRRWGACAWVKAGARCGGGRWGVSCYVGCFYVNSYFC